MENKTLELQTDGCLTKVKIRYQDRFGYLFDIAQTIEGEVHYDIVSLTVAELEQILAYAKGEIEC